MSFAVPSTRHGEAPVGDGELQRAKATVVTLRRELATRVSGAAADAAADAGESEDTGGNTYGAGTHTNDDPSLVIDELVTRLRALHSARDACVHQTRLEGAVRSADSVATSLSGISPEMLLASPGEYLERLEQGAAALKHAAIAIAADQNSEENDDRVAFSNKAESSSSALSVRFLSVSATRAAMATEQLRQVTVTILKNACASTGWPPNLDQESLSSFAWPLAGDDAVDPDNALLRSISILTTLRQVCAVCREVWVEVRESELQNVKDNSGITQEHPEPPSVYAWTGETLAAPVCESISQLFSEDDVKLADPRNPERLFAVATRSASKLVPIVEQALEGIGAMNNASSRRILSGMVLAISKAASDLVQKKYLPACERFDLEKTKNKKTIFANVTSYAKGDRVDTLFDKNKGTNTDVHWLHLADCCCAFDLDTTKALEGCSGGDGVNAEILPSSSSALAQLASSKSEWCERWFACELGDLRLNVDRVIKGGLNDGNVWVPCGIGALGVGYREGNVDPAMEAAMSGHGNGTRRYDDNNSAPVSLPAADCVCDAVQSAMKRAICIPSDTFVAQDGLGEFVGAFSRADVTTKISARLAFVASVAAPVVDTFLQTVASYANSAPVFGSLAIGNGVRGMTKMGHCVNNALRVANRLNELSETHLVNFFGNDVFFSEIESCNQLANRWTDVLVDTVFGAFLHALVHYEGREHLRSFGVQGKGDEDTNETSSPYVPSDLGSVPASAHLSNPLNVLRQRLAGLRAALCSVDDTTDDSRVTSATRTLCKLVGRRIVTHVVMNAHSFSTSGARRLKTDVDSLLGVFHGHLRKPSTSFVEAVEASVLLNLPIEDASRVATACGGAERARARVSEHTEGGGALRYDIGNDASLGENNDLDALVTSAAAIKNELGVFNLDDTVTFAILSKRADLRGGR